MIPRLTYFKRYRMELDLGRRIAEPSLPSRYSWIPWSDDLVDLHAEVKHRCFREELDAQVFPSFASMNGCHQLMRAIRCQDGFCPGASWLIAASEGMVATVQGVNPERGVGAIQNLGVVPEHRGQGLGEALLLKALQGFQAAGFRRAYLEVTAQNLPAIRLYRKHGFRSYRTIYKPVEVHETASVVVGS